MSLAADNPIRRGSLSSISLGFQKEQCRHFAHLTVPPSISGTPRIRQKTLDSMSMLHQAEPFQYLPKYSRFVSNPEIAP